MKSELPLFYYQPNNVSYLEKSLELNKKIFKNILLLKKTDFSFFDKIYKHMSSADEHFEKRCILRFYAMLEYVKENNIDKFLYCDTDSIFLKYLNFEEILDKELCVAGKPEEQNLFTDVVCANFSIWTKDGLESFCNFVTEIYTKNIDLLLPKWNWHLNTKTQGGICDMTLLYHWYKGEKNLYKLNEGVFDRGISLSCNNIENEFVLKNSIKQLKKRDNSVYGTTQQGNNEIEFYGLHFQGGSKMLMFLL
jgi:hypothetical protein